MIKKYKRPAKFTKRFASFIVYCAGLAGFIVGASYAPIAVQILSVPACTALIIWSSWYFSGTFFK